MTSFDEWRKVLEDLQKSVEKSLEEVHQQKAEVQALKSEMLKDMQKGLYYRDGARLIVSSPEVIIGNVDESGALMPGFSKVTLRANQVELQGVGEGGSIESRASSIQHTAVDPGIDGLEAVVRPMSQVVSQAVSINLESNAADEVFSTRPSFPGKGGIRIHADGHLQLEASIAAEKHIAEVESRIKELEDSKKTLENVVSNQKTIFDDTAKKLDDVFTNQQLLSVDSNMVRASYGDLEELQEQYAFLSLSLAKTAESWSATLSSLAEINRQITALKKEKEAIVTGDKYTKESTGASVSIVGERMDFVSADGEGNLRDNEGSGFGIVANEVTIESREGDQSLKKDGSVSISAKTLNLTTINPAEIEYDDKTGEVKKAKYPVEGDVLIRSKNITIEAVDNEIEDSKPKETALTQDGKISMRAETMDFNTTDTEGKAAGSIALNSKTLQIKSMDVDKDKRTDKNMATGSTMLLFAEKMFVGAKDKDNKSKSIQSVSEEIGFFADKTIEAQQGEAKAVLQLADGNAAVGGSKTQIYGETTINGKTEIKDEVKAPKATIDNLEAKTSFSSSNISDGIVVPGAPSSASLSAKLKMEDAPKDENGNE